MMVVLDRAARVVMSKGLSAPYRPLNVKFCIKLSKPDMSVWRPDALKALKA